jgi:carbohydrate-binding DOMON domain-containing protein
MEAVAGSSSCLCKAGYEPHDSVCQPCAFGYYKTLSGNVSCTPEPASTTIISTQASETTQSITSFSSDATTTTTSQNLTPTETPSLPQTIPLAALLGVTNTVFFIIIGAICAGFLAVVVAIITIRKRILKSKKRLVSPAKALL